MVTVRLMALAKDQDDDTAHEEEEGAAKPFKHTHPRHDPLRRRRTMDRLTERSH